MKKLQSRVFQALAVVMLALGSFAFTSCNDDDDKVASVTVNGINYILNDDNTCTVTVGNYIGAVTIPGGIEYGERRYQVTRIGAKAFMSCTELTAVDIPNTVTYIDVHAFDGCSNLTSIDFPTNLTYIGNYAFNGCALTELEMPENVTGIGAYSFAGNKFTEIYLGESLATIGWCAFKGCDAIEYIVCLGDVAPQLYYYPETDEWPFDKVVMDEGIVIITKSADVASYALGDGWSVFYEGDRMGYAS
ncbi:MAG: leucine-rich repeat domain-containing protein [Lachnoclostridium sp.]|nr:leucine-rich repeat domain-containing protein [Lachnoclostridium sp.]